MNEDISGFDEKKFREGKSANFLDDMNDALRNSMGKLGIKLHSEMQSPELPRLSLHVMLVKEDPRMSSAVIMLKEHVTTVREPRRNYLMTTFKIEIYGKDIKSGGKLPIDLVNAVFKRFEEWWKFANSSNPYNQIKKP